MRRSFQGFPVGESRSGSPTRTGSRGAAVWPVLLAGLVLWAAGCSGGSGTDRVKPHDAGAQALADYDTNKDGFLDAKELEACPALLSALKKIDKNNDGKLSPDEIAERLAYFQQSGMQLNVVADIYLDGRPLGGATVTLVPEKFMGPTTKPATATTDDGGTGVFRIEGSGDPVAPGYYRVKVSKNVGGRETVPAKYNEQTTLGQEIVPEGAGRGSMLTVRLRLSSGR